MDYVIISQANRIANGDPDIAQNLLAWNFQNFTNAFARGKKLSVGEQIVFMKHRAGELRSGIRRDFGHGGYHANEDVHCRQLYYAGEVEILHFQYHDESENREDVDNGKGEITWFTSVKDVEAAVIFQVDLEKFLSLLSKKEQMVFLKRLEGFTLKEIAGACRLDVDAVRRWLTILYGKYINWFGSGLA